MKAEKSHYLQSANWKLRKVGGINSSLSKGLRTKSTDYVSPSPWVGKAAVSALTVRKTEFAFPPPFCSTQTLRV